MAPKGSSKGKWEQQSKDENIGYKSKLVVSSEPYKGTHLGTHPCTPTDI
jgi:hypothetical protein